MSDHFVNLAVLRGVVAASPEQRALRTGETVLQFDVVTRSSEGGRVTVPVSWSDPPRREVDVLAKDLEVVVVGWVRRRFFRVGGATQSRTEVVADSVSPARRRSTVSSLLATAAASLTPGV